MGMGAGPAAQLMQMLIASGKLQPDQMMGPGPGPAGPPAQAAPVMGMDEPGPQPAIRVPLRPAGPVPPQPDMMGRIPSNVTPAGQELMGMADEAVAGWHPPMPGVSAPPQPQAPELMGLRPEAVDNAPRPPQPPPYQQPPQVAPGRNEAALMGLLDRGPTPAGRGVGSHLIGALKGAGMALATGRPLAAITQGVIGGIDPNYSNRLQYNMNLRGMQPAAAVEDQTRAAQDRRAESYSRMTGENPYTGKLTYPNQRQADIDAERQQQQQQERLDKQAEDARNSANQAINRAVQFGMPVRPEDAQAIGMPELAGKTLSHPEGEKISQIHAIVGPDGKPMLVGIGPGGVPVIPKLNGQPMQPYEKEKPEGPDTTTRNFGHPGETDEQFNARRQGYMSHIDSLVARGQLRTVDGEEAKRKFDEDNKPVEISTTKSNSGSPQPAAPGRIAGGLHRAGGARKGGSAQSGGAPKQLVIPRSALPKYMEMYGFKTEEEAIADIEKQGHRVQ